MGRRRISETMLAAMELAREKGRLVRRPGGFWTPPGEPVQDPGSWKWRTATWPRDRYVGTQTVYALRKRGLLGGVLWDDPAPVLAPTENEATDTEGVEGV